MKMKSDITVRNLVVLTAALLPFTAPAADLPNVIY